MPNTLSAQKAGNQEVGDELLAKIRGFQRDMNTIKNAIAPLEGRENQAAAIGPYVGQIVHYKLQEGPGEGEMRAGVIMRIIDTDGSVALRIFTDPNFDANVTSAEPFVRPGHGRGQWHPLVPRDVDREDHDGLNGRLEDRL